MASYQYAWERFVPCQGDVVVVPARYLEHLDRRQGNVWYRDKRGQPVVGQLCALDKVNKPTAPRLAQEPIELVADAIARDTEVCTLYMSWSDEYDLEVVLDGYLVHVTTEETRAQHKARAQRQRLVASIACAMARVVYGTDCNRRPLQQEHQALTEEAEVYLDFMLDEGGWGDELCVWLSAPAIYRSWPTTDSEGQSMLERLVRWADDGGRATEDYGNRVPTNSIGLWQHGLWGAPVPAWSLNGLREALGVEPTL